MQTTSKISVFQLLALMTVSSVTLLITCNASLLGGENLTDNFLSCAIAFLCNFVLAIPLFFLMRQRQNSGLLLASQRVGTWFLWCVAIFYILYFLFIDLQYLTTFQFFLGNVFRPVTPTWIFTVMIVLAAVYSAFKGLDAMGRSASVIMTLVFLGIAVIAVLLFTDIHPENFQPLFYNGTKQMLSGIPFYLSGSSCIAVQAILYAQTIGKRTLSFFLWSSITFVVGMLILFLMIGVLGNYTNLQLFPLYSTATIANLGTFQRMDSVFICIWLIGLFLKIALDLHIISLCVDSISPKSVRVVSVPLTGLAICIGTIVIVGNRTLLNFFLGPFLIAPFTVGAAALFPLIAVIGNRIKDRRSAQNA